MRFYILTPHKIEAHDSCLTEFVADDLMFAIQSSHSKIATNKKNLEMLEKVYPGYYRYEVVIGKLAK